MRLQLADISPGLVLVLLGLAFGIALGIGFGVNEDAFKDYVAAGIADNPEKHDTKSPDKIWRYAQRAHFHATGIAAFSIGLLLLLSLTSLGRQLKQVTALLIGLGSLYPPAWLAMFLLAPSIGRDAAHSHIITELLTYTGVGGLCLGFLILAGALLSGRSAGAEG